MTAARLYTCILLLNILFLRCIVFNASKLTLPNGLNGPPYANAVACPTGLHVVPVLQGSGTKRPLGITFWKPGNADTWRTQSASAQIDFIASCCLILVKLSVLRVSLVDGLYKVLPTSYYVVRCSNVNVMIGGFEMGLLSNPDTGFGYIINNRFCENRTRIGARCTLLSFSSLHAMYLCPKKGHWERYPWDKINIRFDGYVWCYEILRNPISNTQQPVSWLILYQRIPCYRPRNS